MILIRKVNTHHSTGITGVYPNPGSNELIAEWKAQQNERAKLRLIDLAGRVVRTYEVQANTGYNQTRLDVSSLAKGQYLLTLEIGGKIFNKKFSRL